MDEYRALRPDERERLERFAAAFDDLDPLVYETFGVERVPEDELEHARAAALRAIGSGDARRDAVKAATRRFVDAADRAIAERHEYSGILFGGRFASSRAEDRAEVLQSLEQAVVAVIVWEELSEDERAVLLGPWAQAADEALSS